MMADYTPKEAAAELGVSRDLLYSLARQGVVGHQRYGRPDSRRPRIMFTAEQLEQIRAQFAQPAVSSRRLRRAS